MPHNISFTNGKPEIMFVGETPWHGLGTHLDKPPGTAAEAIRAAQLDWRVVKKPIYALDGREFCVVPGYQATVRADRWGKEDCKPFGLVGDDYQVLQNSEAFEFFDPVIQSGKIDYDTAGALGDGRRVWVLAKVKDDIHVKGNDAVQRYLLLSNGHDGHTALEVRFTPVRVVCQNTLDWALSIGTDILRTHHGRGLARRVERTQDGVKRILGHYDDLAKHYEQLASVPLVNGRLQSYVNLVFPMPKQKRNQTERSYEEAVTRNNALRDTSAKLFEEGHGNNEPGIRGTLWAAYNGITEMVDHYLAFDSRSQRMEFLCFGEGKHVKEGAFDIAIAHADAWKNLTLSGTSS